MHADYFANEQSDLEDRGRSARDCYNAPMTRWFQFSLRQILLTILFAAISCGLSPVALNMLARTRSLAGPALFLAASSSAGAAVGAIFGRPGRLALLGAAVAVAFMAAIVFIYGIC